MKPVILIQCRASSRRLAGKAFLPVAGIPSVVLCARRAANTGLDVKVVTSTDPSDDVLCEVLETAKIPHFRGDLENVLARFAGALEGVADESPVVRLTADNPFVDGALIDETLAVFQERGQGYLSLHPPALTGTPHGLSVEVFTAGAIRRADSDENLDDHDREHVTPWIVRKHGLHVYTPKDLKPGQAHLRCTLDTWSDYQRLLDVFGRASDPIAAPWQELCDHLHDLGPAQGIPQRFTVEKGSFGELALGTAQLGLPYGIANSEGQPTFEQAKTLVHRATGYGVTHLDCAAAYGDAEERLGRILRKDDASRVTVVTKLSPLTQLPGPAGDEDAELHVEASVYKSCCKLRMSRLPYLLLHRWRQRTSHEGRIWEKVRQLQRSGVIQRLGASVQTPEEALQAIADPDVQLIQLPCNLLDRRFQRAGFPQEAEARDDVIVQARSVLLQGLLVSPAERWPPISGVDARDILHRLTGFVRKFHRENVADLCIAYVRSHSWVDCLVMGMETVDQLDQNVALFQNPPLQADECAEVEEAFSTLPEELLNPALWLESKKETV